MGHPSKSTRSEVHITLCLYEMRASKTKDHKKLHPSLSVHSKEIGVEWVE
jgi:hypothetical protein